MKTSVRNIQPESIKTATVMRKSVIILQSVRHSARTKRIKQYWKAFRACSFPLGILAGVASFLCICLSMEITASILAIICLLCFWAAED